MKTAKTFITLRSFLVVNLSVLFLVGIVSFPALAAEKPIKIGVLLAQTGHFASLTKYVIDGFKVSMDEVNHSVAGRPIEVIYADGRPRRPGIRHG